MLVHKIRILPIRAAPRRVHAAFTVCDTSECERVFSLTNDLKTSERNKLGQDHLWTMQHYDLAHGGQAFAVC